MLSYEILGVMLFNPLGANSTKWSNTIKQFVGGWRRIVWVWSTILRGWLLKVDFLFFSLFFFLFFAFAILRKKDSKSVTWF